MALVGEREPRGEGGDPVPPCASWAVRGRAIALDRPVIMGILNVTPDSFSDGGQFRSADEAAEQGGCLLADGADIIDVGGESTRPQGAQPVDASEELRRVLPVLRSLRSAYPHAFLSVDTVKSEVARAVLDAGADIINDVSAFRLDRAMPATCARARAGVVLMHSRGTVSDMGTYAHARYGADSVGEVIAELSVQVRTAEAAGVAPQAIAVDPGVGFAKRSEHSLAVLRELRRVVALGYPVVVGVSRKRFIGQLSGVERPTERGDGTTAANVLALAAGARIFRVHDVRAARRALAVAAAMIFPAGSSP